MKKPLMVMFLGFFLMSVSQAANFDFFDEGFKNYRQAAKYINIVKQGYKDCDINRKYLTRALSYGQV